MMRNGDKWLTPEALRSGVSEEFAIEKWPTQVSVTLAWAGLGTHHQWKVVHAVRTRAGDPLEQHIWWFEALNDARTRWKAQVRRAKA